MAERLAWDVSEPAGRPPTLLLYELQPAITIGRLGSRCDVALTDEELHNHRLKVRFVGRGGGAVLHAPGQIGVALFAKLEDLGLPPFAVGPYLDRFEAALEGAIRSLRCGAARDSHLPGVFGRTGLLAAVGATAIGWLIAQKVFDFPYQINHWVWLAGPLFGLVCLGVNLRAAAQAVLNTPPLAALRDA